jgi:adenylate cyclase
VDQLSGHQRILSASESVVCLLGLETRIFRVMLFADDRGIGIKGWISGSKPKTRSDEARPEQLVWDKHRIAILPFSNISPDAKDEYFADGMTEELISTLSKISGLVVIARTSVMGYKGGQKKISEVAKELQVGSVLEGSVRKAGKRLRITVQLIDAQTSGHLWAESYDRELRDVFAIQSDISKTIAQTLKVQLLPKERTTIENMQIVNQEAYSLYLKGRFYWNQRNKESLMKAVENFEKAIQLDAEYALAYSGLADSYYIIGQYGFGNPLANFQKAKTLARKALELDENQPEVHATLAMVSAFFDYDWVKAEEEIKKAIELNPSYATAHQWYYNLLLCQERMREAYDEIKKALHLDPLSLVINDNLAEYFSTRNEYDLAQRQIKNVLDIDPNYPNAHWILMRIYLRTSRLEEASHEALAISRLSKDASDGKVALAFIHAASGRVTEAKDLVSGLEKMKTSGESISSLRLAGLSVLVGDVDNGFKWLERAYEERDGFIPYLRVNRTFDTVRSDPRYLSLLKKMGLQ